MGMFVTGILIVLGCIFITAMGRKLVPVPAVGRVVGIAGVIVGIIMVVWSTALYVEDNQGGLVIRKFGPSLTDGKIIAMNGEAEPQPQTWQASWLKLRPRRGRIRRP